VSISLIDVLKGGLPQTVETFQDAYDIAFASATGEPYLGRSFDQVLRFFNRLMLADLRLNRDDINSVFHLLGLERAVRMVQWLHLHSADHEVADYWEWSKRHFQHELDLIRVERARLHVGKAKLRLVPTI
jgi:hypothetical protein